MLTREQAKHQKTQSETLSSCPISVVDSAECQLRQSGYPSLCGVSCQHDQGVLILTGQLATYYLKQMAQTAVAGLEEVEEIVNRIEVLGLTERRGPHAVSDDVVAGNRFLPSPQIGSVLHKEE